jgi:hypothetical protein
MEDRRLHNFFSDHMNEQAASLRVARQKNHVPQVLQDNPNVTWSKLKEVELEWRESQYGSIQHLNLAFRVLLAPKRDDTFSRLKFVGRLPASNESNDKFNYILISDDDTKPIKLDFRRSKTSDSYPRMLLNLQTGKDELAPAGADNDYNDVCPELKVLGEILRKSWEDSPRTFVMSTNKDTYNLARTYAVIQDTVEAAIAVRLRCSRTQKTCSHMGVVSAGLDDITPIEVRDFDGTQLAAEYRV